MAVAALTRIASSLQCRQLSMGPGRISASLFDDPRLGALPAAPAEPILQLFRREMWVRQALTQAVYSGTPRIQDDRRADLRASRPFPRTLAPE
jgi:hypothetical protein